MDEHVKLTNMWAELVDFSNHIFNKAFVGFPMFRKPTGYGGLGLFNDETHSTRWFPYIDKEIDHGYTYGLMEECPNGDNK